MKWLALVWIACTCAAAAGQAAWEREENTRGNELRYNGQAPYAETAALFGPEGERPWAGAHWNPQFVYPVPGRDEEGAVFTVQHGPLSAAWVIARHDVEARHFQYVYFLAGLMVTTIDVRFTPVDAKTTRVHVTYARTSLSAEGDAHVAAMSEGDRRAGAEWQSAIDVYLAKSTR